MIYRCVVCHTHWCAHDNSAHVKDTVCHEHKHLKHMVPMWKPPAFDLMRMRRTPYDHSPVPDKYKEKPSFRSCKVAAA